MATGKVFERHKQAWTTDEVQKLHTLAKKGMALKGLAKALTRAQNEAKCGVIFGHGDHFCAGLDLSEALQWINAEPEVRLRRRGNLHPVLDIMARGYIPFVAALKGATIGGGSTVTRDAPAGQLTVTRARQMSLSTWKRPVKSR